MGASEDIAELVSASEGTVGLNLASSSGNGGLKVNGKDIKSGNGRKWGIKHEEESN